MIQATVRHRLSRDDAQLIARLIARDSGQPVDEIEQAISDQGIDAVLDDPRLPAALMRAGQGACASLPLFLYVMVRHALRRVGEEDRRMADYVAAMLMHFGMRDNAHRISAADDQVYDSLAALLAREADIVIGDRNIKEIRTMSWHKKLLQRLGSWTVRQVSGTEVPDTTSGFRAYTRDAALQMTIVSEFSYTLETIIQAGKKRMAIAHVEIATNPRTRPSRLFDSMFSYLKRSAATIVRIYAMYEPLKIFTYIGTALFLGGFAISLRFLYYWWYDSGDQGKVQSLILAATLMIVGFQVVLIGLMADVISGTRKLLEDLLYRVKSMELRDAGQDRRDDGEHRR